MKELLDVRANYMATWTDEKKFVPQVEVVLLLTEAAYSVDAVGAVVRGREVSQVRFTTVAGNLRTLADVLVGIAGEVEQRLAEIKPA